MSVPSAFELSSVSYLKKLSLNWNRTDDKDEEEEEEDDDDGGELLNNAYYIM
jgi:hypothetical protein